MYVVGKMTENCRRNDGKLSANCPKNSEQSKVKENKVKESNIKELNSKEELFDLLRGAS
jgi:hypothetical protein